MKDAINYEGSTNTINGKLNFDAAAKAHAINFARQDKFVVEDNQVGNKFLITLKKGMFNRILTPEVVQYVVIGERNGKLVKSDGVFNEDQMKDTVLKLVGTWDGSNYIPFTTEQSGGRRKSRRSRKSRKSRKSSRKSRRS
jgi:hypothetical protein